MTVVFNKKNENFLITFFFFNHLILRQSLFCKLNKKYKLRNVLPNPLYIQWNRIYIEKNYRGNQNELQ